MGHSGDFSYQKDFCRNLTLQTLSLSDSIGIYLWGFCLFWGQSQQAAIRATPSTKKEILKQGEAIPSYPKTTKNSSAF